MTSSWFWYTTAMYTLYTGRSNGASLIRPKIRIALAKDGLWSSPLLLFKSSLRSRAITGRDCVLSASGGPAGGQGVGPLLDDASDEDVMEWFIDEVASYEPHGDDARKSAPAVQVSRKTSALLA